MALYCTQPDGTEEQLPCAVEDASGGAVSVIFTSSSCSVAGDMRQVIIRITWSDASNSRYVGPRIHVAPSPSDDAVESSNEFALLDQLIIQAQEVIGDAGEAASAANTATGAANTAANAANTAAGAANTAATAANAAKRRGQHPPAQPIRPRRGLRQQVQPIRRPIGQTRPQRMQRPCWRALSPASTVRPEP